MLTFWTPRSDWNDPRDWKRPWRDPPGFFTGESGCFCCGEPEAGYRMGQGTRFERYDVADDSWASKAAYSPSSNGGYRANGVDGLGYKLGDLSNTGKEVSEYTPGSNSWAAQTDLTTAQAIFANFPISTDIHLVGNGRGAIAATHQVYDTVGDSTSSATNYPISVDNPQGATVGTKGYVYGGRTANLPVETRTLATYEWDSGWTAKTDMPSPARTQHGGEEIGDLVYSFDGTAGGAIADTDEYDPVGDSWTSRTDSPTPRQYASFATASSAYLMSAVAAADFDEYTPDTWTARQDMLANTAAEGMGGIA